MKLDIPGRGTYDIEHIVFDYNGTLAENGKVRPEIMERLGRLARLCSLHVVTADTFGTVEEAFADSPVRVEIISREKGPEDKEELVKSLGQKETIAVGNGFNDRLMLKAAALGFCIMGPEGAATQALLNSDAALGSIDDFFALLEEPQKLIATLRG